MANKRKEYDDWCKYFRDNCLDNDYLPSMLESVSITSASMVMVGLNKKVPK